MIEDTVAGNMFFPIQNFFQDSLLPFFASVNFSLAHTIFPLRQTRSITNKTSPICTMSKCSPSRSHIILSSQNSAYHHLPTVKIPIPSHCYIKVFIPGIHLAAGFASGYIRFHLCSSLQRCLREVLQVT